VGLRAGLGRGGEEKNSQPLLGLKSPDRATRSPARMTKQTTNNFVQECVISTLEDGIVRIPQIVPTAASPV
jgi:hypothetical protein